MARLHPTPMLFPGRVPGLLAFGPGTSDENDFSQMAASQATARDSAVRAVLDRGRQVQAKRLARQRQALSLINLATTAIVIGVLLFTPLGFALRDALAGTAGWQPIAGWHPFQVGAYFLVLFAVATIVSLAISYYSGFVLSHRYGMSTQTLGGWVADYLKGFALSLPFELAAVLFVFFLLAATPDTWWIWTGIAMLCFTVLLANVAPILFVPLFYKMTPLPDGEVRRMTLALAERAGTRIRGVFIMHMSAKTTAANAMVMGLGNTRRVVIGDTLLDRYTPDEIESVVAHELGHQVHNDIPQLILVETLTTLGGLFVVNLVLHAVVGANPGYFGLADAATMPLVAAALGIFGLVTLPITNGFSRWVEYRADVYALDTTRDPQAFISAMTRLANQNLAELEPSPLVEFFLYNHPSTGRRLALGRRYAQADSRPVPVEESGNTVSGWTIGGLGVGPAIETAPGGSSHLDLPAAAGCPPDAGPGGHPATAKPASVDSPHGTASTNEADMV